ncbi:hypothetical protein ACE6H2_026471 [Prunus campanulata]
MLRYANRSMYGLLEVNPAYVAVNVENVSSTYLDAFNKEVTALFKGLGSKAAGGGDLRKFAPTGMQLPKAGKSLSSLYVVNRRGVDLPYTSTTK